MILEETRVVLHELRGVNLRVDFFLGTREEFLKDIECVTYSICWESVDIIVDQLIYYEPFQELEFSYGTQQLFIDDQIISGDVISFRSETIKGGLKTVYCKIALGRAY